MGNVVNFGDERLPERFWSKVQPCPMSGCWIWVASLRQNGYGQFGWMGKPSAKAHRVAYETLIAPITPGLEADHLCRQRCCVNPAHIEPVTKLENIRRGESRIHLEREIQRKRSLTHCKRGHELSGDNLYVFHKRPTQRICRKCRSLAKIARRSDGRG